MHYSINNTQLNVLELGNGPLTLVFLHYFGGSALEWQVVMNQLAGQYRCLAVDLRGHGDSEASATGYSVPDMANDVVELLRVMNVEAFALVGHSMGGKVALALASQKPAGLQSLVLLAPSPPVPEPIPDNDRADMLANHGQRANAEQTVAKITARSLSQEVKEQIVIDNLRTADVAWKAWLTLGSKEDISEQMSNIIIPVAILVGTADQALLPNVQTTMTLPYLKTATLDRIDGAGHLLPWETPNDVVAFIQRTMAG
ncbi:alpha/beta hydrolase [Spirosoma sp. KCTC 42546]|uniref:alpha/beta fold hydrolase n=1 Tax=Spirosoma sp. KCTC 42546 TaxID=2520506 RepID=UPI0011591D95|nr:alpha/beta hydrolase [Spirosoma sp. KCTC 42546]QDK78625.1 alpha/beta hydrolase [Spirosoma sp. KCTC 42546]